MIPRSLDVGDKQYRAAILKPQHYFEVKRITGKEMLAGDKNKTMVLNSGAVCIIFFLPYPSKL